MAVYERGTPEWWFHRLIDKHKVDVAERALNAAYYDSINPSPEVMPNYRDAYKRLLALSKTPWGRLVVDIVEERLTVNGFAIGEDNLSTDKEAWDIFRRNRMDALQRQVHREALALGTSYASAWKQENGRVPYKIAHESAMAVTHETVPGEPYEAAAVIKLWHDPIQWRLRGNLYLPETTYKFQSEQEVDEKSFKGDFSSTKWEAIAAVENPDSTLPIIPFTVRPTWEGYGVSDLEDLRPIIARIETLVTNTLLAVEFGAFRQRWATGLEIPTDDQNQPIEPFKVALDRLWVSADENTKFGAFDATDIRPYLQAISDAIGQLSAVSRIPTLYFNQSELSNPPSAASLEASETGLIRKVNERQALFAESWERIAGIALGEKGDITVSWDDPRTRSEAQSVDAAVKLHSVGVPFQGLLEYLGYNPDEVARLKRMRSSDTFDRLLNTPLPAATRINQEQPASQEQPPAEGE